MMSSCDLRILNDNKQRNKNNSKKKFECKICLKSFTLKGNLKTHMRTHTGERPFECKYEGCGSAFKTSGHLNEHWKIHLSFRPFKCPFCKGKFSRLSTLRTHLGSSVHKESLLEYNSNEGEENIEFYNSEELKIETTSSAFFPKNLDIETCPIIYNNQNINPLISSWNYLENLGHNSV